MSEEEKSYALKQMHERNVVLNACIDDLKISNDEWKRKCSKYKSVLDKIKEYCNHKLEMLELQKRNIMQILTPENGYLKADIEIEMQKYKDILELLEEIE